MSGPICRAQAPHVLRRLSLRVSRRAQGGGPGGGGGEGGDGGGAGAERQLHRPRGKMFPKGGLGRGGVGWSGVGWGVCRGG